MGSGVERNKDIKKIKGAKDSLNIFMVIAFWIKVPSGFVLS